MGNLGLQVSVRPSVSSSICQHLPWVSCEHISSYSFVPTLYVFSSWYEDVHVVWILLWDYFLSLFPLCELSHFLTSMYRQWVPCERNTSYSFIPIFSNFAHVFAMVWRCACALDIILELIFVTFSTLWTLSFSDLRVHFLTSESMKVYRQRVPFKRNSLYNFMPIFIQLCTSFCPWFEDVHVVWI